MLKVYDMSTKFHGETAENIEKLDEMLTQYGVDHAFMLPTPQDIEEDEEIEGRVLYTEDDEITFDLVVMLFCKTVLNKSDDEIKEAMRSITSK